MAVRCIYMMQATDLTFHRAPAFAPTEAKEGHPAASRGQATSSSTGARIMPRLKDKRTLITGGTTGIDPANIAKAQAELGPNVLAVKADSASVADQKQLAERVTDRFGQLDVA